MDISNITHINQPEIKFRATRQRAVQQTLDQEDRGLVIGAENRPDYTHRVDRGKL